MRTLFSLLLAALFCPTLSFSQQTIKDSIMSGGQKRFYRVYIPAIYNAQNPSVPLLFVFHGQPTHPNSMLGAKINHVADTANFIIVYPYGQPASQPNTYYWDFYSANFMTDVNFISNLIDKLLVQYNIDSSRIYSAGASGGGFMAYSLACNLSHRIAAVASVMGTMMTNNMNACKPPRAVPIMEVHGTSDSFASYEGDTLTIDSLDYGDTPFTGLYASTSALVSHWVTHNNCNPTPTITDVPDINPNDGCTAQRYLYSGGTGGSTVELYKITGGGHTWPGWYDANLIPILGPVCMDFSANREIWRFLRQYRLG